MLTYDKERKLIGFQNYYDGIDETKPMISTDVTLEVPRINGSILNNSIMKIHKTLNYGNKDDFLNYRNMQKSVFNVSHLLDSDRRPDILCEMMISMVGFWGPHYRAALFDALESVDPSRVLVPFLKYGNESIIKEAIGFWKRGYGFITFLDEFINNNCSRRLRRFIVEIVKSRDNAIDKLKGELKTQKIINSIQKTMIETLEKEVKNQKIEITKLGKRKREDDLPESNKKQKTE